MSSNDQAIDEILQCSICLDYFERPKILPCQHTFCFIHIEDLIENGHIKCPVCRRIHKLTSQDAAALPTSITIQKLLDSNIANIKKKCFKCSQRRDDSAKCVECDKLFCSECNVEHCLELKDEIEEKIRHLQRDVLPQLNNRDQYYKQKNDLIKKKYDSIKENITASTNEIVNELLKHKQSLLGQDNNHISQQGNVILLNLIIFYSMLH
jgi:hypothetical protein